MSLNPVLRRNGEYAADMRVTVVLNGDMLARAVCLYALENLVDWGAGVHVTKSGIEEFTRNLIKFKGVNPLHFFGDAIREELDDDDKRAELWSWAREEVLRLYPSLTVD